MKVVLLAGGYGTRISEESQFKPKPMIEIGGKPILWHIMKHYSYYGFNEFLICAGYKQEIIKEWFANYYLYNSDITFDLSVGNTVIVHKEHVEPWKVSVIDTGLNTLTGGRIKRIKEYIGDDTFLMTYGDGVSDIEIDKLVEFHMKEKRLATLSAVIPAGRFGTMDIQNNQIISFREKSCNDMSWINAGFMVLNPRVIDYIHGDQTMFEREPLETLAQAGQLACYKHYGFWQCMDTLKDKNNLEKLWEENRAPWKIWK